MTQPLRRIVLLAYPEFEMLDVAGPCAVFGGANKLAPAYEVVVASAGGGEVMSSCGVRLGSRAASELPLRSIDTLMVAGAEGRPLRRALHDPALREFTRAATPHVRRLASVCSGAFLLCDWGLADGRRVATHWRAASELARAYPAVAVDPDALFVEDGPVWTSAGVTTGIDMSLAMVEQDLGAAAAQAIARDLVLHARRPGWQSQFSALLEAQGGAYADLVAWIGENLSEPLDVEQLAARAGQSPRTFHRRFSAAVGRTPAAFVERLRLDAARTRLEAGEPLKAVAMACGFGSLDRMGRAFKASFGLLPSTYRALHAEKAAA